MEIKKNIEDVLSGFIWIRNSGMAYFKWFSPSAVEEKWSTEEVFFTGFLSALNSGTQVFFDDEIITYIEMESKKIYTTRIENGDLFTLIVKMDCPDSIATELLKNMTLHYFDHQIKEAFVINKGQDKIKAVLFDYINQLECPKEKDKLISRERTHSQISKPHSQISKFISSTRNEKDIEFLKMVKEKDTLDAKINSLTTVSRTIGHTFNNILSTIMGNISLAKLDIDDPEEMIQYLNEMEESCKRASDLSLQLLTISKSLESENTKEPMKEKKQDEKKKKEILSQWRKNIHKQSEGISTKVTQSLLIMDDETSLLKSTTSILEKLGYNVENANNGQEAIQLFKNHQKEQKKPYLMTILDFTSKGGMSGMDTFHALKKLDPNIKAVISTGYVDDKIISNYKSQGLFGIIKKPFNVDDLRQILKKAENPQYEKQITC